MSIKRNPFEERFIERHGDMIAAARVGEVGKSRKPLAKGEKDLMDLQEKKAAVMRWLREAREKINRGERIETQGSIMREISWDGEIQMFLVQNGEEVERASFGDLMTDLSYGIGHSFDVSQVPTEWARKYIAEFARVMIDDYFDLQILIDEHTQLRGNHVKLEDEQRRTALGIWVSERRKSILREPSFERKEAGKIFELNVITMLRSLQFDFPEWDIEVEKGYSREDALEKIDFIVRLRERHRGVVMEETASPLGHANEKIFGIQFTLSTNTAQKHKDVDIIKQSHFHTRELDDILVISVPVSQNEIFRNYLNWKRLGKPSGGPERLFDINTKLEILRELLKGMGVQDVVETNKMQLARYYDAKLQPADKKHMAAFRVGARAVDDNVPQLVQ